MNFTKIKEAVITKIAPKSSKKLVKRSTSLGFSNGGAAGALKAVRTSEPLKIQPKPGSFDELLKTRVQKAGWLVRQHINDANFKLYELAGREVTFSLVDEQGKSAEYSGILEHSGKKASAFFRLEGQDKFFNANTVGVFAVKP